MSASIISRFGFFKCSTFGFTQDNFLKQGPSTGLSQFSYQRVASLRLLLLAAVTHRRAYLERRFKHSTMDLSRRLFRIVAQVFFLFVVVEASYETADSGFAD
jgi:hypothetical protein